MSAENGRLQRVDDIAALARHAPMSSSYKPALLKAIVSFVKRDAPRNITLKAIVAEYVELYGVQTVVFRLRQAATTLKEPVVVREIRSTADRSGCVSCRSCRRPHVLCARDRLWSTDCDNT